MGEFELLDIPDAAGNTCRLVRYKGRLHPDFPRDCIRNTETFKLRDDDVLVITYPKSGTHWMWEIVRLLRAGTVDVPLAEHLEGMLDDIPHERIEAQPSPRTLNTHSHFEQVPQDVLKKKTCKIIYVTRDPRDVAVSYFHHIRKLVHLFKYKGEWKDFLPMFLKGQVASESWFEHTRGWEDAMKNHPDLEFHVASYEGLHEDIHGEIRRVAKFLGVPADDTLVNQIVEKASFNNMRNTKGMVQSFVGVPTPVMYRKGIVGDWKNWFTVAEAELFDAVFEKEMRSTKAYELYSNVNNRRNSAHSNGCVTNR